MTEESNTDLKEPIERDPVPSQNRDQSSNQADSAASNPESRRDKFSGRIVQYPCEELKLFEKNSLIGSGGFGKVCKYHHKDKIVAVKEFAIAGDDETISSTWNMVRREANILCRFQHENIVEILGITQWPNVVGIIMEYIDGGNLQGLLSKDNQSDLSWNTRLEIAKGITSGLDYIHNYGEKERFCHGDLKPANVLLTSLLQVRLADFGSAALHRATAAATTTTKQVSSTQFTLIYVAPEFLEDNTRKRNPTMDMYSFGMVLYEVISRKVPYSDSTMPMHVPALIMAKIKPSMKLIDNAESELGTDDDRAAFNYLKKLMLKCWNSDPNSRPSSKTVKMEVSGYILNQSQGFGPRMTVEPAGTETGNATGSTARKLTKQPAKSSTSGSSAPPFVFGEDRPSTSFDTASPQQTSSGRATMENLLKSLGADFSKPLSGLKETLEKLLLVSGASFMIGNHESVQDLLEKYTDSLLNHDYDQADFNRATLRSLVVDDVNADATNVMLYAEKLKSEEKYLQSVAVYDTAAALYAELKNPEEDMERLQLCIQGMKLASEKMIDEDSNMKAIVGEQVLPLMRNWLSVMKATTLVSEKWKCHTVSWALSNIELCETWVEQWENRKRSLEEAVSGMRRVFGSDVHKLHGRLFGTLLNNLGVAYKRESRFEEASVLFKESVDAHKAAVDYFGDDDERKDDLEISERNLKSSMRQAWEKQLQMK